MTSGYVIQRVTGRGGFVRPPGSERSYTQNLAHARRYATYNEADRDRCVENEVVVAVEALLQPIG